MTLESILAIFTDAGLPPPFITPEEDEGIGLWWKAPESKRELDLDFIFGTWTAIKTTDIDLVRTCTNASTLDSLVQSCVVTTDAELRDLATWLKETT